MKASDMLHAQQKFTETSKSKDFYNYSGCNTQQSKSPISLGSGYQQSFCLGNELLPYFGGTF